MTIRYGDILNSRERGLFHCDILCMFINFMAADFSVSVEASCNGFAARHSPWVVEEGAGRLDHVLLDEPSRQLAEGVQAVLPTGNLESALVRSECIDLP